MKALILAAGFGTRLLPHTQWIPKPLFPMGDKPLIDRLIHYLSDQGITEIMVNTHHLHGMIETHIRNTLYPIPVHTCFEPVILDTGGAIKNLETFWDNEPFVVFNGDIKTTISLKEVIAFHRTHLDPVTLVMHHRPPFNTVVVDEKNTIQGFLRKTPNLDQSAPGTRIMAFTGIHVIDPSVLDLIPEKNPIGIIDVYAHMIEAGQIIRACPQTNHYWIDIGTPESYSKAVFDHMVFPAFQKAFGLKKSCPVNRQPLKGDGSDRLWERVSCGPHTLVMVNHGIRPQGETAESDAFIAIGNHLKKNDVPVPSIISHDAFSGIVFVDDLGDTHLKENIETIQNISEIEAIYRRVVDITIPMNIRAGKGFKASYTWQTPCYDRALILDKECRYFVDAFLNTYLHRNLSYEHFAEEFELLADNAMEHGIMGFMHRDLQSKNIMVKDGHITLIDFQGGRTGPLQYDIASLLIDPYAALSPDLQCRLRDYAAHQTEIQTGVSIDRFLAGYTYLSITRNLQMLGAFGYLTREKHKPWFETYIPQAVATLKNTLAQTPPHLFPTLKKTVEHLCKTRYQSHQPGEPSN